MKHCIIHPSEAEKSPVHSRAETQSVTLSASLAVLRKVFTWFIVFIVFFIALGNTSVVTKTLRDTLSSHRHTQSYKTQHPSLQCIDNMSTQWGAARKKILVETYNVCFTGKSFNSYPRSCLGLHKTIFCVNIAKTKLKLAKNINATLWMFTPIQSLIHFAAFGRLNRWVKKVNKASLWFRLYFPDAV